MSIPYDEALVEQIGHTLDLREPNQKALDRLAQALDDAGHGEEFVADLATGVGKTYIAGGLLDYLYESGIRNVVIVTPGSTIQTKTINNLTPGHRKYLRGLQCNPLVITLDTVERGEVAAALADENRFKVFVFTVQSLLGSGKGGKDANRRAHKAHETLGQALYEYLANCEDLVVIADEHHIYYSTTAKKFQAAIDDLHPSALIGLTATPHPSTKDRIVYEYKLSEAIADGYVKIPVLVSRRDGIKDKATQLADGLTLLDAKRAVMRAYCEQTKKPYVEPIMFLVASTIDEANEYKDLLAGPNMLDDPDQILLVTSEEPDATLALLDTLESPGSKIRAVVSVSMLKEGWDVRNIYVIASVRSMESQLLTEQILGRGLRLPFGARTGNPMLDTVEVLSHDSFATLLKQARVLLEETLGERADAATAVVNPANGQNVPGIALAPSGAVPAAVAPGTGVVEFLLPGVAAADPAQLALFEADDEVLGAGEPAPTHVGFGMATVDARLNAAAEDQQILTRTFEPRSPGGIKIPLYLPRVTTKWVRDPFSLTSINNTDVEALGRQFAKDNAPTLLRKALDSKRDASGEAHVVISDLSDSVIASQVAIPYGNIETDLVARLMATNGITATVGEANAALGIAQAFLTGADVTIDTPWRAEHGRLATTRLAEWINTKQTTSAAREVKEVHYIKWPEPPTRTEPRPPANRHVITRASEFVRGYPYEGWNKSIYEINAFDAYSTEFCLAALFESSPDVVAWVRINETVPLRIAYLLGAVQKQYEPDFIVIDAAGTHWIVEGKADSEMTSPIVTAKRDAAFAWVSTVNTSDAVHHNWGYLLASESVIGAASSWAGLKAGGQVYQ